MKMIKSTSKLHRQIDYLKLLMINRFDFLLAFNNALIII